MGCKCYFQLKSLIPSPIWYYVEKIAFVNQNQNCF